MSRNIKIENDKGRLSKEEIDRMVSEAERYKAEDDAQRERIAARSQLESYIFSVKQAVDEAGDKLSESDKSTAKAKCDDAMKWLDNTLAEKDEYEHKLQEIQRECVKFITKIHQGGSASCGQQSGNNFSRAGGPTIEEVD